MEFFFSPIALARIAGLSISSLEDLRFKKFFEKRDIIFALNEKLTKTKNELIEILYNEIKNNNNQKEQQFLLNIKRNIFNERPIDCSRLTIKFPNMQQHVKNIERYKTKLNRAKEVQTNIYKNETLLALECLFKIFNQHSFNTSLTIANIHFKTKLNHILSENIIQLSNKKHRHALQTLVAYLFRATCRTTPFSGFSTTSFFNIDLLKNKNAHVKIGVENIEVQPNRSLFKEIIKALINSKFFIENAHIYLDEFLFLEDNTWYFTSNDFGESKQINAIKNSDLLKQFINLLLNKSSIENPICAKFFLNYINELKILPEETAECLLLELVENGLIKFKINALIDSPNWLNIFLTELSKYNDKELYFQIIFKLGQKTKDLSQQFSQADQKNRDVIFNELKSAWSIAIKILNNNTNDKEHDVNSLLYEDRYTPINFPLRTKYSSALDSLTQWVARTGHLSLHKVENAAMRHFFDYTYKEQNTKISFTTFFKDYYVNFLERGIIKPTNKKNLNQFHFNQFEYNEQIQKQRNLLHKNILKKISETKTAVKEIYISTEILNFIQKKEPQNYSVAAFVQPTNDGKIILPNGRFHMGFGKYLSRFFNLVSKEKIADIFIPKQNNCIYGEIRGGVWFNGNLTQPILDTIIPISGTFQNNNNSNVVLLKNLDVVRDGDYGLILLDKISNKKIIPLDLGTLDARQTPPVRKLLNCFSDIWSFTLNIPWTPQGNVTYRPRIIFEKDLILERRKWLVLIESIPFPKKNESESHYLNEFSYWLKKHDIPNQLFIKILDFNEIKSNIPFLKSSIEKDHDKFNKRSKFYDFENPFSLFEWKTLISMPKFRIKNIFLELEEFYPSAREMVEINGDKKALEIILHLKNDR